MHCSKCGATLTSTSGFCGKCGAPIVGYSVGQAVAPTATAPVAPGYAAPTYAAPIGVQAPAGPYAGFWLRVAAAFIDGIVISIPIVPFFLITMLPLFSHMQNPQALQDPNLMVQLMLPEDHSAALRHCRRILVVLGLFRKFELAGHLWEKTSWTLCHRS